MAYVTEAQVRSQAAEVIRALRKSARQILNEDVASIDGKFDVFLSHSSAEPEEILLGIKALFEKEGMSVYVDRYSDPHLALEQVTSSTAAVLRQRMHQSKALLYVYSRHSTKSRWMPWELGYFDGLRGRVGIFPVTQSQEEDFKGEEYLSLYPYVDQATDTKNIKRLWINKAADYYALLGDWIRHGTELTKRS